RRWLARVCGASVPIPHSGKRSFRHWLVKSNLIPTAMFQSLTRASDHSDISFTRGTPHIILVFQSLTRASDHSDSLATMARSQAEVVPIPHSGKRSFRPTVM